MSNNKKIFWIDEPEILYKNYNSFFPKWEMSIEEKLNAVTRFLVYLQFIFFILSEESALPTIIIAIIVGIYLINRYLVWENNKNKKNKEKFDGDFKGSKIESDYYDYNYNDELDEYVKTNNCKEPSKDNPYMNDNYKDISSDKEPEPPCMEIPNPHNANPENINKDKPIMSEELPKYFASINDLYQTRTMDREHYPTEPYLNDQKGFALWLYGNTREKEYLTGVDPDHEAKHFLTGPSPNFPSMEKE
jgi:hypothetical protein